MNFLTSAENTDVNSATKFPTVGGHVTLNFVNTLEWRLRDPSVELMESYEDLLVWSKFAGVLDAQTVKSLRRAAKESPREAARVHSSAIKLREAIYRVIEGLVHGSPPDEKAVRTLNAFVRRTFAGTRLGWTKRGYAWRRQQETNPLEAMFDPIVRATSELLTSDISKKISQCQDDRGCGWLFLDRSRSHARRWCSMSDCGNRAKAKRHHKRAVGGRHA